MKFLTSTILLFSLFFTVNAQAIDKKYHHDISKIVSAFKLQDKQAVAALISYPLKRQYPVPMIDNAAQLVSRFEQVFDEQLIQLIADSSLENDWSVVGWRGVMFGNGQLWLDDDGKIKRVNYQSEQEKELKQQLIASQKKTLHSSIRAYKQPILEWKTAKFQIRVDDLGSDNYRYASWSINKSQSEKPDLVLTGGKLEFDGSGGNHQYSFAKGKYLYRCYVNVMGKSDSVPGFLEVFKGKKQLLSADVLEVLSH